MFHGLDHIPVKEYMTTELASVERDAELQEIQEKIIENKQRLLPVIDNDTIIGVITRTDLLNIHGAAIRTYRSRFTRFAEGTWPRKNQKHR